MAESTQFTAQLLDRVIRKRIMRNGHMLERAQVGESMINEEIRQLLIGGKTRVEIQM